MEERISVIVPVYNVQKYLDKCVESILRQSYDNLEVVLVDDGSTDLSGEMCDAYAARDERVKVIHQDNGGLSDARNAGMDATSGQYLCFVDSDDYLEEDTLQKAYQAAKHYNAEVVIWGFEKDFYDLNDVLINKVQISHEECRCRKHSKDYEALMNGDSLALVGYAWNKLYRTDLISEKGFRFKKGVSLVEDILFNSPVLSEAQCIAFIDTYGSHYIQRKRETLGARFYQDYFDLKLQACRAREDLLRAYGATEEAIFSVIIGEYFAAIKSSCRMVCKNTEMSKRERYSYMKTVGDSRVAREVLRKYNAKGKDALFKAAILMKQYWVFEVLYKA